MVVPVRGPSGSSPTRTRMPLDRLVYSLLRARLDALELKLVDKLYLGNRPD